MKVNMEIDNNNSIVKMLNDLIFELLSLEF